MSMPHTGLIIAVTLLAGCGAEVAGTAATVGVLQAKQAQQAQQAQAQQRQAEQRLGESLTAVQASASAAAAD